jgi:uncharacterized protein (TIRG00374 family)
MKHKTSILFAIGILIMCVMLYFIGINDIIDALKIADIRYILLAIIAQVITYYLFALRWKVINKIADIFVKSTELLPMVLVGMAINNITPSGRGGGEPVKAYILSAKTDEPFESTFATTIADRALDTIPFLILAIVTIILMILNFHLSSFYISLLVFAVILITLAFILLIYISINQTFAEKIVAFALKIVRIFYKKDPEKLEAKIMGAISGFQDTMRLMLRDKDVLFKALPLSFLIWFSEIIRVYFVFLAFGSSVNVVIITEVFIISCLIGMIPLLPGGLGAVEVMMVGLFTAGGVPKEISAVGMLIERLISFWMTTIIGLIILPHYGISAAEKIKEGSNKSESQILDEFANRPEEIEEIFDKKDKSPSEIPDELIENNDD